MAEIGSKAYRIKSKMVHMDLLRGLKETSILLDTSENVLKNGHEKKSLPFPSIKIEGTYIFYIPTFVLRGVRKVQELGVTKVMQFLKYIYRERLSRMLENDYDWESYDLSEWK